ncbi:hypothetical protein ABZ639_26975 [Saccharomonospora sp. NPDC006951]
MTVRLIIARPLPGTVGETRRMAHVFPAPEAAAEMLVAYCGSRFATGSVELLDAKPTGMPCERCLATMPRPGELP